MRAVGLIVLLLAGCEKPNTTERDMMWRSAEHHADIIALKAEVEQLKAQQAHTAITVSALEDQVSNNARIANENRKIDEAQWNWTRNHVHQ